MDDELPEEVFADFIRGRAGSPSGEISPTLFQDLVELTLKMSERMSSRRRKPAS